MSARRARPIEHPVAGGFCQVCGELEEWLRETGAVVVCDHHWSVSPTSPVLICAHCGAVEDVG